MIDKKKDTEIGNCFCGCGGKTSPASRNRIDKGWVKGKSLPYIQGHNRYQRLPKWKILPSGCWKWLGAPTPSGYGMIRLGSDKQVLAHRYVYEKFNGLIPDGLTLDHLCRNEICVNPDHLEPVTQAENVRRGLRAKLSFKKVESIYGLLQEGASQTEIADKFGVSQSTISNIKLKKNWNGCK